MVRGHNNKRPPPSAAKVEARRQPRPNMRPKAKPTTIVDERKSQFRRGNAKAPDWVFQKKMKLEKIPGTRIQFAKGGWPVRVVEADGKQFPVDKVESAKRHLRVLAQREREQNEVEDIIARAAPGAAAPAPKKAAGDILEKLKKRKAQAPSKEGNKKARKAAAQQARKQRLSELHAAAVERDGRRVLSNHWHVGVVEEMDKAAGRVWVRLQQPELLAPDVVEAVRVAREAASSATPTSTELFQLLFGDVAEAGLNVLPGLSLRFKIYADRNGVGVCEASSGEAASPCPPEHEQESGTTTNAEEQVAR